MKTSTPPVPSTSGRIVLPEVKRGENYILAGPALEGFLAWGLRPGEAFTLTDALGGRYRARFLRMTGQGAEVFVFEEATRPRPVLPSVTLLQALPAGERMELVIEKTVELGVEEIVPFRSARSITLREREKAQKKAHRWQARALRASKQSRREFIARVHDYTTFSSALGFAAASDLKIFLYEGERTGDISDVLRGVEAPLRVAVLAGPEGGFEPGEVEEAVSAGFIPASISSGILRAETASIAAVAIVIYELAR